MIKICIYSIILISYVGLSGCTFIRRIELSNSVDALNSECLSQDKKECFTGSMLFGGGLVADDHNLYIVRKCRVIKFDLFQAAASNVAGQIDCSDSSQKVINGVGETAQFSHIQGIVKLKNFLYVSDSQNNQIRKIDIDTWQVSTVAGGITEGCKNGVGSDASFKSPTGMVSDGESIYISDTGNGSIRKLDLSTAEVSTVAGNCKIGNKDGIASEALFSGPRSLALINSKLYVSDIRSHRIRMVDLTTKRVSTIAGGYSGLFDHFSDGTGATARFYQPMGLTTEGKSLFVTDTLNRRIRKIDLKKGTVSTVFGNGKMIWKNGHGTEASFYHPSATAYHKSNLYVLDCGIYSFSTKCFLRKINLITSQVTTLAGVNSI